MAIKEELEITIFTDPQGSDTCKAVPPFVARRGSEVTFTFDEFPDADLIFDDESLFGSKKIKPGKHKVKNIPLASPPDASVPFTYRIVWVNPPGTGNGSGEVPPG
jgi:hypothetical protein